MDSTEPASWLSASGGNGHDPIGRYRDLMASFPSGVAVVTAIDAAGRPYGMTCTSLASAALDPPTLLVCLRIGSATLHAAQGAQEFAVNLLHEGARRAAALFSGPVPDRFARVQWRRSPHGLPWLDEDAMGLAECAVVKTTVIGDHCVLFGEVMGTLVGTRNPLLYGLRAYAAWPAGQVPAAGATVPAGWLSYDEWLPS